MRVGIALGSNLGDRLANLRRAREMLLHLPGVDSEDCVFAPVYETTPVDCPPGAGGFLNSVGEAGYAGNVSELLRALQDVETAFGRARIRGVNLPREIDLDLLYAGDQVLKTTELILPHPRMCQRRFVLAPLARIRPNLVLPGQTITIAALLDNLDDDPSAVALANEQW